MILPGNEAHTLPIINYDEIRGTVHIKGKSISPEVEEYYGEFLPYFKDCLSKAPQDLKVTMELEYFNTKSSRILMTFFGIIKDEVAERGFSPDITWILEEGDEDMREAVEDYEDLTKLKMKIEEVPEE